MRSGTRDARVTITPLQLMMEDDGSGLKILSDYSECTTGSRREIPGCSCSCQYPCRYGRPCKASAYMHTLSRHPKVPYMHTLCRNPKVPQFASGCAHLPPRAMQMGCQRSAPPGRLISVGASTVRSTSLPIRPLLQRPQMKVRPASVSTIVWLPPHAACMQLPWCDRPECDRPEFSDTARCQAGCNRAACNVEQQTEHSKPQHA